MPKKFDWLTKRIAAVQEIAPDTVRPQDMARFFLSNGVDQKGQAQTGYNAKGNGLGVDISIDPGKCIGLTAAVVINANASQLKQAIIAVTRGPSKLAGTTIVAPIVLVCVAGKKWIGKVDAAFSLGAGAECSAGITTGGGVAKAEHEFNFGEEDGEAQAKKEKRTEIAGVSASFHIGLEASAGVTGDHYFGWDPSPMFYSDDERTVLANDLGNLLSNETRKRSVKREAMALLNRMRKKAEYISYSDNERHALKVDLHLKRKDWTLSHDFDENYGGEYFIQNLQGLANALSTKTFERIFARDSYQTSADVRAQAEDLIRRLKPFQEKACTALCWLKINSVTGTLSGKIGAKGNAAANVTLVANAKLRADFTLVGAEVSKRRTRVVWQIQQGVTGSGNPFLCTQDTVINYTSFNAKALSLVVKAAAEYPIKNGTYIPETKKSEGNYNWTAGTSDKGLNVMTYQSSILYWECPGFSSGTIGPLPGSGVAFGQSVVIQNLLDDLKLVKIPRETQPYTNTPWLCRMARSLRVTEMELAGFLVTSGVEDILNDLSLSTQNLSDRKSAPWGDRGVLLESSFRLRVTPSTLTYKDKQLEEGFRMKLLGKPRQLQAMRLRFRISDIYASEEPFRLGFKLLGTGMGVTFKKVEQAGTEGIVTLCCQYVPDELRGEDQTMYEEDIVPPVTLFSQ